MEYCRREAFTEFSFKREFDNYPDSMEKLVHTICGYVSELEGGEFFVVANQKYPLRSYILTFYFYNADDAMLAKLSI